MVSCFRVIEVSCLTYQVSHTCKFRHIPANSFANTADLTIKIVSKEINENGESYQTRCENASVTSEKR